MNILIVAIGSAGDVHPFLGIGREMLKRGHRVTVCASPAFEAIIDRCGLRFLPIGTEDEYHAAMNNPALWNPRTSFATLWKVVASTIRPLFEMMVHEADENTVVLGSLWAFGARLAQEKFGLPLVTAQVSPSTILSARLPPVHKRFTMPDGLPYSMKAGVVWLIERAALDTVCGPTLNKIRSDLGLPPVSRVIGRWMHSPEGVLGLFPEWFAVPQSDWPPKVALTGFPLFDEVGFHRTDPELEDFLSRGPKPVVFTLGSTVLEENRFFHGALETLSALGMRGLFLTSNSNQVPELPASILLRSYVPMSTLLPRAAARVQHGGIGTSALALAAGIPQLATPFAHDQFDNATRIERLGCGIRIDAPAEAPAITRALRRILEDQKYEGACHYYRRKVESGTTSCGRATDVVEAVGRSRRALVVS